MLNDLEQEFVTAALEAARDAQHATSCSFHPKSPKSEPCSCHVGKARVALSVIATYGNPTREEREHVLGTSNWVVARRTPRILARYGSDVMCLSSKKLHEAERAALKWRAECMGVKA